MNKQKEIAIDFLQGVITDRIAEVYELYTLPNMIHHNPFFKGDRQSLLKAMGESNIAAPNKQLTVKRTIAEAPYITVFSHVQITDKQSFATVHTFRFEGNKIAELWDVAQQVPEEIVNENGMF